MAKCPVCNHDVHTPFFLNLDAWAHLRCTNCQTRLEMKPPASGAFAVLWGPLIVFARQRRLFEVIVFAFMLLTMFLMILECIFPKVRVRKKLPPKPEIRLNLDDPSN